MRELLKVARLLYDASRSADKADISDADAAIVASVPIDAAQMRQASPPPKPIAIELHSGGAPRP